MVEPDSITLVLLLLAAAVAALWTLVRVRALLVRLIAGLLALALAGTAGMAVVNDYYGYYRTWSQMSADLNGSYTSFASTTVARTVTASGRGRIVSLDIAGAHSGINRTGLVYLPPQYFDKAYAHTTFPVVELIHGTPGNPTAYTVQLNAPALMNHMLSHHQIGPMILVMPTMSVGHNFQECVNAPGALDDTYITQDVRTAILTKFRASPVHAQWGIAGFSSGGYCAANLALRHRKSFGAAGIMDGYYRPQDGPAAAALHSDPTAEAANNPLLLASQLRRNASPLPAFWISAGTGSPADIHGAQAFAAALHGVEQVKLFKEPSAGHNFYAWSASMPRMLTWMWTQLAPPELRVQFPIAGAVRNGTLIAPPPIIRYQHKPKTATRSRKGSVVGQLNTSATSGSDPRGARSPAR